MSFQKWIVSTNDIVWCNNDNINEQKCIVISTDPMITTNRGNYINVIPSLYHNIDTNITNTLLLKSEKRARCIYTFNIRIIIVLYLFGVIHDMYLPKRVKITIILGLIYWCIYSTYNSYKYPQYYSNPLNIILYNIMKNNAVRFTNNQYQNNYRKSRFIIPNINKCFRYRYRNMNRNVRYLH